nr:immunoglobulin heavy chain junction region [Mus musculus]
CARYRDYSIYPYYFDYW